MTEPKRWKFFSTPAGENNWTRNFTCKLDATQAERPKSLDLSKLEASCPETATPEDFYRKMEELGLNYGPKFQTIASLRYSKEAVVAQLKTVGDIRGFTIPPTLLDGALHCLAVGLLRDDDENLYLPVGIGRCSVFQPIESEVWCYAQWKQSEGKLRTADITLMN